jgi:hypothetical protein
MRTRRRPYSSYFPSQTSSVLIVDMGWRLSGPKGRVDEMGSGMAGGLLTIEDEAGEVQRHRVVQMGQVGRNKWYGKRQRD